MNVKYPLSPIKIYATKPEFEEYKDRLGIINITEIGEASVVWGIPNSYLIRYIINTYLKRHRLGVD